MTSQGAVKLGDFGFARKYAAEEGFTDACGTNGYAAPEVDI